MGHDGIIRHYDVILLLWAVEVDCISAVEETANDKLLTAETELELD